MAQREKSPSTIAKSGKCFFSIVSSHLIDLHSEMLPQHKTVSHLLSLPFVPLLLFCVDSDVVCRKRIRDMKKMQDEQLKTEIKNLEAMQQSAYDQIRFHRLVENKHQMKCRFHR